MMPGKGEGKWEGGGKERRGGVSRPFAETWGGRGKEGVALRVLNHPATRRGAESQGKKGKREGGKKKKDRTFRSHHALTHNRKACLATWNRKKKGGISIGDLRPKKKGGGRTLSHSNYHGANSI